MTAQHCIEQLIFEYARRLDAGDFESVAHLFRDAVLTTAGGDTRGYAEVLALYRKYTRLYADGTPCTRHLTTNLCIELDEEDRARARSCFTVMQALPDFPLQPIICGDYLDEFVRADGGWRFNHRQIKSTLHGDLSRHLLVKPGSGN